MTPEEELHRTEDAMQRLLALEERRLREQKMRLWIAAAVIAAIVAAVGIGAKVRADSQERKSNQDRQDQIVCDMIRNIDHTRGPGC